MRTMLTRMPCLFVNHGGGPMPLLGMDDISKRSLQRISAIASQHSKPKAILVVSAHWEASPIRVTSSPNPSLLFDYYGFPPESYEYKYPAKGDPTLAQKVKDLLNNGDIDCELDGDRGYDHGLFVPLLLAYPDADIPVVEMSLHPSLDSALHLKIGRALEPLRKEGVLILGSGMSFHNMRAFIRGGGGSTGKNVGGAFDQALVEVVTNANLSQREAQIKEWEKLPEARFAHPREEHLAPLFVCIGAAGDGRGEVTNADNILGAKVSGFSFL